MRWPMQVLAYYALSAGIPSPVAADLLAMSWPFAEGDDSYTIADPVTGEIRYRGAYVDDVFALAELGYVTLSGLADQATGAARLITDAGGLDWHPGFAQPALWSSYVPAAQIAVTIPTPGVVPEDQAFDDGANPWPYDPSIIDQTFYDLWTMTTALERKWAHR